MGMSKKFANMKRDRRADIGIGTMIIFIAMVLTAAVAASVLISTANQVREQALATGDEAINNVATGFVVQDVVGTITTGQITQVDVYFRLASGSPNVNIGNVMISYTDAAGATYEAYTATLTKGEPATGSFGFEKTLDVENLGTAILGQGDLGHIILNTDGTGAAAMSVGTNEQVTIKIIPAYGQSALIVFTTPEQLTGTVIDLQ